MNIGPGNVGKPRSEIIFVNDDGREKIIPIPDRIRSLDSLKTHLARQGVTDKGWRATELNCAQDEDGKAFVELVERLFDAKVVSTQPTAATENYPVVVPVSSFVPLSDMHHRAIAKIGFHFFLKPFCPPFTGTEPIFNGIKRFICRGGTPSHFMFSGVAPIDRNRQEFPTWAHVISAGWCGPNNDELGATVQLFAGSNSGIRLLAGSQDGRVLQADLSELVFDMVHQERADTALLRCPRGPRLCWV